MESRSILAQSFKIPWKISQVLKDYCEWSGDRKRLDRTLRKNEEYLADSCNIGDTLRVSFALYLGFDIHAWGDWALRRAAYYGYADVCKLLLDHGADVHADNDYALRWAAYNGCVGVCALLLDYGADVHARVDCALRWAAENGRADVCKLLKKYMNK